MPSNTALLCFECQIKLISFCSVEEVCAGLAQSEGLKAGQAEMLGSG